MKREQHNEEVTFAYWNQSAAGMIITIIIFGIFTIAINAIIDINDIINIIGNVYA